MSIFDKMQELAGKIPGYAGYRDLESRRASDRALRESTATAFQSQLQRLGRVQEQAIKSGDFESVESLDEIMNRLRHLVDRLRTASEGYGGLYDEAPVREEALDRLYDFDLSFAKGVETVADQIAQMGGPTPVAEVLPSLLQTLDDLHNQLGERQALIERPHEMRPGPRTHDAPTPAPYDDSTPAWTPPASASGGESVQSVGPRTEQGWSPAAPVTQPTVETPVAAPVDEVSTQTAAAWSPAASAESPAAPLEGEGQVLAPMTGDAPAALEPPPAQSPRSLDELASPPPVTSTEVVRPDDYVEPIAQMDDAASGAFPTPRDSAPEDIEASWSPATDAENRTDSGEAPHSETWR